MHAVLCKPTGARGPTIYLAGMPDKLLAEDTFKGVGTTIWLGCRQ